MLCYWLLVGYVVFFFFMDCGCVCCVIVCLIEGCFSYVMFEGFLWFLCGDCMFVV